MDGGELADIGRLDPDRPYVLICWLSSGCSAVPHDKGAVQRLLEKVPRLYWTQITCLIRHHCGTGYIRDCRDRSAAMPFGRRYAACRHQPFGRGDEAYGQLSEPNNKTPLHALAVTLSPA